MKRQLDENNAVDSSDGLPTRKKRKEYSERDAQLAKYYSDLADDIEDVRLKAAANLITHICSSSAEELNAALTRLIKGLTSNRKAARVGFSLALSEVARVVCAREAKTHSLRELVDRVVKGTAIEGNVSGQERRDALLGAQFGLQALLSTANPQSRRVERDIPHLVEAIVNLASQKPWLRRQCGAMLHDAARPLTILGMGQSIDRVIASAWSQKCSWKTPEGIALWLSILSRNNEEVLPKHVWDGNTPFSPKESYDVAKIMQELPVDIDEKSQSGSRQVVPSFAWKVVIDRLVQTAGGPAFQQFWNSAVNRGLFGPNSSNERKALGLQVVTNVLPVVSDQVVSYVFSQEVVQCIINHRSNGGFLFGATKVTLKAIEAAVVQLPWLAAPVLTALLEHGSLQFDQITKTKTIETIMAQADNQTLEQLSSVMSTMMQRPGILGDESKAENQRRLLADMLVSSLRSHREEADLFEASSNDVTLMPWVSKTLQILAAMSYQSKDEQAQFFPALTEATTTMSRTRLMSCIGHLLSFRVELAILAPQQVLQWTRVDTPHGNALEQALKLLNKLSTKPHKVLGKKSTLADSQGLILLLSMSVLQVYNEEPDAAAALQDLIMSAQSWKDESEESKTVLIEIVLSFISKPSAAYKKLAEQVFGVFASSMTSDSLQSLLDILEQKESASGQRELFGDASEEQPEEKDDSGDDNSSSSDDDAIDVEDDTDVEIVNGVVAKNDDGDSLDDSDAIDVEDDSDVEIVHAVVTKQKNSSDDANSDDFESISSSDVETGDEDEEAIFDRKLAEALGTAGGLDSDDDGSDMDDDQMMELEPHLATIFKERQKQTSAKQDNKDARENIVSFKNRILDLLNIFVKQQHSNPVAIELIHPLIVLIRTTTSKPTSEKAYAVLKQYFDAYNKDKTTKLEMDDATLFALLAVLHAEVTEGGSKLHNTACSRSCLFVAKVLVSSDLANYDKVANMYSKLQSAWYRNSKSKVQSSMFTEWNSWSIATRKQ